MLKTLTATAMVALIAGAANAAPITEFKKTTNDGVFSLSQAQADALGYSNAAYLGFLRVRSGRGVSYSVGDTFDVSTLMNTFQNQSSKGKVIAFLNGINPDLSYSGDAFDDLGTTTLDAAPNGFFRGVAFLFAEGVGNITFKGTSTFNQGTARDGSGLDISTTAAVPVPAALPLLLAGLGGLGIASRRRKAAA